MLEFILKKCLCGTADCDKCLTLGCTDDNCSVHRIITKWRYRKHLLGNLMNKVVNPNDNKSTTLQKDIKICREEVKHLESLL